MKFLASPHLFRSIFPCTTATRQIELNYRAEVSSDTMLILHKTARVLRFLYDQIAPNSNEKA
jgi:hypothetical protein